MILTVTLNPSIDIQYQMNECNVDAVNRVSKVNKTAGGKGLNVTRVLRQLNKEVRATGFIGGSLGDEIRKWIKSNGVIDNFISISGNTRNCIAIIAKGQQTEILESGPTILKEESKRLKNHYEKIINHVEVITISGSLPAGVDENYYSTLIEIAHSKGKKVLLDTNGSTLEKTLDQHKQPFLIKPNIDELSDYTGVNISGKEDIIHVLNKGVVSHIPCVVVTQGGSGAIVKFKNMIYEVAIPKVPVKNPVGSGDSVIAGFAAAITEGLNPDEMIRYGITMGTLNAMNESTGQIDTNKISWCKNEIKIKEI